MLFLLAAFPEVPCAPVSRFVILALIAGGTAPMAHFVSKRFSEFEASTLDFREILKVVPRTPRLFSLVYFQGGSKERVSPFLHLSAWIQAEKGGALGFHFASWNLFPVRYRSGSPEEVPPALPERFEWNPQDFRVMTHGLWFDTFLVRHRIDPSELFRADPSVHLVAHRGPIGFIAEVTLHWVSLRHNEFLSRLTCADSVHPGRCACIRWGLATRPEMTFCF